MSFNEVVPNRGDLVVWVDANSINGNRLVNKINNSYGFDMNKAPTINGTGINFDGNLFGTLTIPNNPSGTWQNCTILACVEGAERNNAIIEYSSQGGGFGINNSGNPFAYFSSSGTYLEITSPYPNSEKTLGLRYHRPSKSQLSLISGDQIVQSMEFLSNPLVGTTFYLPGIYTSMAGRPTSPLYLKGKLYCLKIYNSALTSSEIVEEVNKIKTQYL